MGKLKKRLLLLVKSNNTPREIALGVAIGVFIAITPLYGFHTLMVIIFALLIPRTNKIAILVGTNISIPPTTPLITWAGYSIGKFILGNNYPALEWLTLKNLTFRDIPYLFYPLFVGSLILGIICAIVFYFIVLFVIGKMRKRKKLCAK